MSKRPMNSGVNTEHVSKRTPGFDLSGHQVNHDQGSYSSKDLPKTTVMTLNQGSPVTSMDFHPIQQHLLLVGTNGGAIQLWNLSTKKQLVDKKFKLSRYFSVFSIPFKKFLNGENAPSVTKITWSPDGKLFGVAYSMHLVEVYSYDGQGVIKFHLEIEAHCGSVNDLAFSNPNILTCGDDMLIKVWSAETGTMRNEFKHHEAPVYCVCPHVQTYNQLIYSSSIDGKMKVWSGDQVGQKVGFDAPGRSSTTMAYSADGTRLFSCGTNKEGDSYLLEWKASEVRVNRMYNGLRKPALGVVQFHTTRNRFIAAFDDSRIKFWDMDNENLLTTLDVEGGQPHSPCIKFNNEGSLLAISTNNGMSILANPAGILLLQNHFLSASGPSTNTGGSAGVFKLFGVDI